MGPPHMNAPPIVISSGQPKTPGLPGFPFLPDKRTTVYVGKIAPGVEDDFVKQVLEQCGGVDNWKRMKDPISGDWKGFGFCDFKSAEGALRALRVLADFELEPGKPLMIKVDEKASSFLEEFKQKKQELLQKEEEEEERMKQMRLHYENGRGDGSNERQSEEQNHETKLEKAQREDKEEDEKSLQAIKTLLSERLVRLEQQKNEEQEKAEQSPQKEEKAPEAPVEGANDSISGEIRRFRKLEEQREKERRDREREREREREKERKRSREERDKDKGSRDEKDERGGKRRKGERDERDREGRYRDDRRHRHRRDDDSDDEHKSRRHRHKMDTENDNAAGNPPPPPPPPPPSDLDRNELNTAIPINTKIEFISKASAKKTGLAAPGLFNPDEEDNSAPWTKKSKRPLITIDQEEVLQIKENEQRALAEEAHKRYTEQEDMKKRAQEAEKNKKRRELEEKISKVKDAKALVDFIPTGKDELFDFDIDWDIVDDKKVIERLDKFVGKKIREYIGTDEPSLVQYILEKVQQHTSPQTIKEDLSGFLDEEAEIFVIKMWRMLIYEILRVKAGLAQD